MRRSLRHAALFAAIALCASAVSAGTLLGAVPLRARHSELAPQLAASAFGEPLSVQSREESRQIEGHAWAVLDMPFATVAGVLAVPERWCEILMLHLNNKYCELQQEGGRPHVQLRVGRKHEQPVHSATLLDFAWQPATQRDDYVGVEMRAPDGPYDTRDYRLVAEAVPLAGGRTFLHLGYAFGYGRSSHLAMHLYLATIGRDKVGFSLAEPPAAGRDPEYVGGMRGVVERNVMRYHLAIRSYLEALPLPPAQRLEARLRAWFDATERHPRQLHEIGRDEYLRMKRNEHQRVATRRIAAD